MPCATVCGPWAMDSRRCSDKVGGVLADGVASIALGVGGGVGDAGATIGRGKDVARHAACIINFVSERVNEDGDEKLAFQKRLADWE